MNTGGLSGQAPQSLRHGERQRIFFIEVEMEELRKEIREKDVALIDLTEELAQPLADYQDVMLKM